MSTVPYLIQVVLSPGTIGEILKKVVRRIAVQMANFMSRERRSDESSHHERMNGEAFLLAVLAESHVHMPSLLRGSSFKDASLTSIARQALHSPFVRYLVKPFKSRDWEPLFLHENMVPVERTNDKWLISLSMVIIKTQQPA
jgi:hypothetical protein